MDFIIEDFSSLTLSFKFNLDFFENFIHEYFIYITFTSSSTPTSVSSLHLKLMISVSLYI